MDPSSMLLLAVLQVPAEVPHIVSVEWLAQRTDDSKLVLLQIGDDRSKATYDAGHIRGTQFVHPWRELSASRGSTDLSLELPDIGALDSVLESKGISDDSKVVLVSADEYFTPTARAALVLQWAGMTGRVAILDGGLEAWKAAGHPVTADVPAPRRGHFTPRPNPSVVVTAAQVLAAIDDPQVAVVDARDQRFFDGADTRQGRNGHIPGARNLPFPSVLTDRGTFKSAAELRSMFREAGAVAGGRVVSYCHIGQQASLVWFAAQLAGFEASLYDGSFQEWARRPELPIVTPQPEGL